MSVEDARTEVLRRGAELASHDAAAQVRRAEAAARRTAEDRARRIVATAVQRVAAPTSAQSVVTLVELPTEEMKGRIIGREGRNIRALRGPDRRELIVDDTPDAVLLSGFDAVRREIALRRARRAHRGRADPPARIEERRQGRARSRASLRGRARTPPRAGVTGLHPELVEHRSAGSGSAPSTARTCSSTRSRARTSPRCWRPRSARTSRSPAGRRSCTTSARRSPPRSEGRTRSSGPTWSGESASRRRRATRSRRTTTRCERQTVEAVLVQAADAMLGRTPRRPPRELEKYVKRMDELESLVAAHSGRPKALAMPAGREVRVIVEPEEVADVDVPGLAVASPSRSRRTSVSRRDQGDGRPRDPRERDRRLTRAAPGRLTRPRTDPQLVDATSGGGSARTFPDVREPRRRASRPRPR